MQTLTNANASLVVETDLEKAIDQVVALAKGQAA